MSVIMIGGIFGYTQLAISKLLKGNIARRHIDKVASASHRAADLVGQILNFSRKSRQEIQPVQISSIVKEVVTRIRASLPSTIDVRHRIGRLECQCLADPTQIHQVLMNLCTNAAQAMGEDGVLSIEPDVENIDEAVLEKTSSEPVAA